jgi:NAD(P)H-nitrite reductase large subunit
LIIVSVTRGVTLAAATNILGSQAIRRVMALLNHEQICSAMDVCKKLLDIVAEGLKDMARLKPEKVVSHIMDL